MQKKKILSLKFRKMTLGAIRRNIYYRLKLILSIRKKKRIIKNNNEVFRVLGVESVYYKG